MAINDVYSCRVFVGIDDAETSIGLYYRESIVPTSPDRCRVLAAGFWEDKQLALRSCLSSDARIDRIYVRQVFGTVDVSPFDFYPTSGAQGTLTSNCFPPNVHCQLNVIGATTQTRRGAKLKLAGIPADRANVSVWDPAYLSGPIDTLVAALQAGVQEPDGGQGFWIPVTRTESSKNNASPQQPRYLTVSDITASPIIFGFGPRARNRSGFVQASAD